MPHHPPFPATAHHPAALTSHTSLARLDLDGHALAPRQTAPPLGQARPEKRRYGLLTFYGASKPPIINTNKFTLSEFFFDIGLKCVKLATNS
ncbi:Protein of unknown function [Gryllus bimaculatus]|nr:Protein of unknown function [Gryllus bimaculatus]